MRSIGSSAKQRVIVVAQQEGATARVEADRLLGTDNKLVIAHGSNHYLLRLTRNGKLILTK